MTQPGEGTNGGPKKAALSVGLITFNEEHNIRACLESVRWADEIVVVDSFSTDKTVEIAKEYSARVIQREWPGFVEQRDFSVRQANCDWVLLLDADERVSPELAKEIQSVQARDCAETGFTMPRKTHYLGQWITHGGWYPGRKLRLVRRGKARVCGMNPHDHMETDGPIGNLKGDLHHYTYRDISDHLRRIDKYTTTAAAGMYASKTGHPVLRMLVHPAGKFAKMYLLRLGFLDGVAGFIIAALSSYYVFLKYAKLWELRRTGGRSD